MAKQNSIPLKIRSSPEVAKWLEHNPEFKIQDFAEHGTEFYRSWRLENEHLANILTEVRDHLAPKDQKTIDLFLQVPPRVMAKELGIDRGKAYGRVKRVKSRALAKYRELRSSEYGSRKVADPKKLSPPVKKVKFAAPGQDHTEEVRLVLLDNKPIWVDSKGGVFPDEIQDLLDMLPEMQKGFEVLDVIA